jgi:hypothetical protein
MERVEMPIEFKGVIADQLCRENDTLLINEAYEYCDMLASLNRIYITTNYKTPYIHYTPGSTLWHTAIINGVHTTRSWDVAPCFKSKKSKCFNEMIALLQELKWSYNVLERYIEGHHMYCITPSIVSL